MSRRIYTYSTELGSCALGTAASLNRKDEPTTIPWVDTQNRKDSPIVCAYHTFKDGWRRYSNITEVLNDMVK